MLKISLEMKGLYLSTLLRSWQCGYRRLGIVRCTLSMQWIFWQTPNKRENWVMSTKGVKKGNLLAFMPKIMYFCLCKLSQRSSKYSEFSYVSPTCDSSIISSDANLKTTKLLIMKKLSVKILNLLTILICKTNRNNKNGVKCEPTESYNTQISSKLQ